MSILKSELDRRLSRRQFNGLMLATTASACASSIGLAATVKTLELRLGVIGLFGRYLKLANSGPRAGKSQFGQFFCSKKTHGIRVVSSFRYAADQVCPIKDEN